MEIAPCVDKCPINLPIPDYIRLTNEGRFNEAYLLIAKEACIPSILGRICFHPCEDACRRGDVDEPISICNIKRFLGDTISSLPKQKVFQKERIAVIGGGPSGLSCAWHLLQLGYRVDVFEEKEQAGGMPCTTIPSWRLPPNILKKEIENLVNAGLSIKTNKRFGDDFSLDDLKKEYDAIVIACGLPLSRGIKVIDGDGVIPALKFLEAIKFEGGVSLGNKVLVIGGGNVAIDCARASLRMERDVSLICLEDYENMPCFKEEKIEAEEEGVKIFPGFGPKELVRKNGKIEQLVVMKVLELFDENKRFSPKFDEKKTRTFDVDTIIMAIGQMADWDALKKGGVTQDMLKEDGFNGLFACGDIVLGPSNVASAIASGRRTALAIHCYFKSEGQKVRKSEGREVEYNPISPISAEVLPLIAHKERVKPECLEIEQRRVSFNEIEKTYTLDNVFLEAGRCLYCGKGPEQKKETCALCLTCIRVCPLKGIKREEKRALPSLEDCQSCGICAGFCPDNAIRLPEIFLKDKYPRKVTIACFDCPSYDAIRVRCILSVGIPFFLSLIEKGVEKLAIAPCKDFCFVPCAKPFVSKMINRLSGILKEIGLGDCMCLAKQE
ncbi:MAG: FAD-dependent oxidoreductase [bacterium]